VTQASPEGHRVEHVVPRGRMRRRRPQEGRLLGGRHRLGGAESGEHRSTRRQRQGGKSSRDSTILDHVVPLKERSHESDPSRSSWKMFWRELPTDRLTTLFLHAA
jgi:hypothetical protein